MPTTILASRYNTLRNLVNKILGASADGDPTYGYGQGLSTNSVVGSRAANDIANADKVSAQDYEDLYIDLIRIRSHQVSASQAIDDFVIGDYNTNTATSDKIEAAYIAGLETLANTASSSRFIVAPSNLTIASLVNASSSRLSSNGTWNGTISHIFTVTFTNALERRHFFNAGGEIRLSASVDYTGSQAKTVDWQSILNTMGTTSFKAETTTNNAGVGVGTSIGNYDLTTSYRRLYTRDGGAVYANNEYRIFAREYATGNSTSAIQFKINIVDGSPNDPTYGIDEAVLGTFNSVVQTAIPNSQVTINGTTHDAVVIDTVPTGTNIRALS
jgi:hypothetical protein|tara:strand:- start:24 stop:1010 length:987 start_codon:yes stop_codon:yes gene_type:complete